MLRLSDLKGVGEAMEEKLHRLGLCSLEDLVFHLPRSYEDRTRLTPSSRCFSPDAWGSPVFIEGQVIQSQVVMGRRRSLFCLIQPVGESRYIAFRFFYFNAAQTKQFTPGRRVRAYGIIRVGPKYVEMIHPEYQIGETLAPIDPHLTPLYALTEGMTQTRLRNFIRQAFDFFQAHPEALPELFLNKELGEWNLLEALKYVHFPPKEADVSALLAGKHPAQERLILEELLAHRLMMQQLRTLKEKLLAPALLHKNWKNTLMTQLPFPLTGAQHKVIGEIEQDLTRSVAMHRLLQGDVGSGKTIVALFAGLQAVENGYQVALMVPTEILAEQHAKNLQKWLEIFPQIRVECLVGSLPAKRKEAIHQGISSGQIHWVIGTQALFQEKVQFAKLGLVIMDEQHRFGVEQRQSLLDKSEQGAHQLVMTATPIPRTLAMTAYADLDISIIDELPPGRTPIQTVLIQEFRRDEVVRRIIQRVHEGHQVYWVCTLIEESEALEAQAAEELFESLKQALAPIPVGLVHGRMKPKEKQQMMEAFKASEIQVLVATTVIEVGVDVPNASVMIIENAERLGLSQLHQLRGRVGRGSTESFCLLMFGPRLSAIAKERLLCLKSTTNGFEIAEKDLELRGAGEVLGTKQTGEVDFKIADLIRDRGKLKQVNALAENFWKASLGEESHFNSPALKLTIEGRAQANSERKTDDLKESPDRLSLLMSRWFKRDFGYRA